MNAIRLSLISAGVSLVLALAPSAAMSETVLPAQDIEWENLQPDVPASAIEANAGAKLQGLEDQFLSQADPFNQNAPENDSVPASEEEAIAELSRTPKQETAPVVDKFNGKRVRLAGYIVPLDFEATKLKQFLLVPYVGACIHVPAPPTNQVVFIDSKDAVEFTGLYDPVYVTGTMSTTASKTELAEAGYHIKADGIQPYE